MEETDMTKGTFKLHTKVVIDSQGIDELTIQKLVDEILTKVPADNFYDSYYDGSENDGWEIEFIEEVSYKFYPSNSWYDPDEYDYSDFADDYEYDKVVKEFAQAHGLDLDYGVTNDF